MVPCLESRSPGRRGGSGRGRAGAQPFHGPRRRSPVAHRDHDGRALDDGTGRAHPSVSLTPPCTRSGEARAARPRHRPGSLLGWPPSAALLGSSAPALALNLASLPPMRRWRRWSDRWRCSPWRARGRFVIPAASSAAGPPVTVAWERPGSSSTAHLPACRCARPRAGALQGGSLRSRLLIRGRGRGVAKVDVHGPTCIPGGDSKHGNHHHFEHEHGRRGMRSDGFASPSRLERRSALAGAAAASPRAALGLRPERRPCVRRLTLAGTPRSAGLRLRTRRPPVARGRGRARARSLARGAAEAGEGARHRHRILRRAPPWRRRAERRGGARARGRHAGASGAGPRAAGRGAPDDRGGCVSRPSTVPSSSGR
jgi:hypothetical protein